MNKIITRKEYLDGDFTHDEYYGQFIIPSMVADVYAEIGEEWIKRSRDEHMNDIPLAKWDALCGAKMRDSTMVQRPQVPHEITKKFIEAGDKGGVSLSDMVCIYKAIARRIKDGRIKY